MRREDDRDRELGKDRERGDERQSRRHEADWVVRREGPSPKLIWAGVMGVLLLIFVLQNTNRTSVDFLFWGGEFPLYGVIVVSAVLGFLAGWALGRIRRRIREAERGAEQD